MKKLPMIYKTASTLFLLVLFNTLWAQTIAERALYRDTYSSKGITSINVTNKYGSIQIKNWDKDSVKISTDVYLSSTTQIKLDKLKSEVSIKYTVHNGIIKAQTLFGENQSAFMKEMQDLTRSLTPGTIKRIEINYEIFIPKHLSVQIKNQYGDVFLESVQGELKVDQSNGSFKAYDLNGETNLKFSFVNAMVNDIKNGVLVLNYSNINFNKSVSLNCESKSSEIYAEQIGVLKLKSSRDKIDIGTLNYIYGSSNYTKLKIHKLNNEINGYFTYGQIDINKMGPEISLIDIDSERTDIKLYIPKRVHYKYDIFYHENADLILPQKQVKIVDSMDMEGMKSIKGNTGEKTTLDIRIRALKRCLIQIIQVAE